MAYEYATTIGDLVWDEPARDVVIYPPPIVPEGEGWRLVSSVIGELRFSKQPVLWFWERPKTTA